MVEVGRWRCEMCGGVGGRGVRCEGVSGATKISCTCFSNSGW